MTPWHWIAIATIVVAAWMWRYDVEPTTRGDGVPPAYILDRWTGEFYVASPAMYRRLLEVTPTRPSQ